jgi:hypothetical protein
LSLKRVIKALNVYVQLGIKIVLDVIYKASIVLLACVVFLKNVANV